MAKDTIVKAEILCHSARTFEVVAKFEEAGEVDLIDISATEDLPLSPAQEPEQTDLVALGSSLEKAIAFLQERFASAEKSKTPVVTLAELEQLLGTDDKLKDTAVKVASAFDDLQKLGGQAEDAVRKIEFLDDWLSLGLRFDQIREHELFVVKAGVVSGREGLSPLEELERENNLFSFEEIAENRVVVVWHKETDAEIPNLLNEAGFVPADFAGFSATPTQELERAKENLDRLNAEIARISAEIDTLADELVRLETLSDATELQMLRTKAIGAGRASKSAVLFHVWVREADLGRLKSSLEELGEVDLELIEPREGEIPPVYLTETKVVDPYVMLTDMYGRPQEKDPDPTPLMAPFYAVFFGVCIGDAGYGLALAAGSAAGWYFTKKKQGDTRLFRLLFQGALASIVWGFFLGGWFGASFNSLPGFLQDAAMPLNRLLPNYVRGVSNGFALSQQFLYLTLGFGIVQLAWGIIVNLRKRLDAGEGLPAVVDQTGWLLALLGLFPWLFNHYLLNGSLYPTPGVWDQIFLYMLAVGALLIFVMGGREAKGIGGKAGLGAYACYGIVNLLGDVLSYSRLFALALSSTIIASVINQIAGMLNNSVPVLGIVLAVVVLVAGHLFNLAMAVLSGFIHTARLQFVEFFTKFYDGTGVPFKSFRYQPKYVRIRR